VKIGESAEYFYQLYQHLAARLKFINENPECYSAEIFKKFSIAQPMRNAPFRCKIKGLRLLP
jgi:hypothetical protein